MNKNACSLTQARGLPSLIYHETALEVRFVRGAAGTTSSLTIRVHDDLANYNRSDFELGRIFCPAQSVSAIKGDVLASHAREQQIVEVVAGQFLWRGGDSGIHQRDGMDIVESSFFER
jgi:hypothetical protein